ncbi:protein nervous wreck-like isoform X23 [Portunus trituberculatus]|uniref:protein nervous wreck-like isoform X23 n=1 Tax=Portunus trituberculatus TaxID=210409 RepID=UPI001E1CC70C|nr:protein nervous wreck-like isoform X23 [Portunus trituberculatus]
MQPPPRKGNYLKVCKNLHSEQLSKLLAKNQQECDLLEDIRNFTKQRSSIEKSYGEALCKIAANYQNRKIACVPDIRLEDGSDAWNVYSVWRTVLDETEKLGKARLAAVEVFQQNISEDAKVTRQNKIHLAKKFSDQLKVAQGELQTQVQELERAKRNYYEEEHVAHDAREKASAAEERLKRKKGSIFQSIQSLQKNSAKFSAKRDACDEKSTGARNDYLLTLAASNAHQRRYYEVDFERFLRTMECDMYDKVAEYLTLMSRTELLTCSATQSSFNKIKEQATTVTRGYNLRCYLTFYPMLGQNIQYDYEPCEGDSVEIITVHDDTTQTLLEQEGRRCVTTIQKDVKSIREATRKIQKLNVVGKHEYDLPPDIESKLDDQRLIIRRAETSKVKMECKIEVLKEGGVEVEDYAKSLDSDSLGVEVETSLSRSESTLSVREEAEAPPAEYEKEEVESNAVAVSSGPESTTTAEYERGDSAQTQDDGRLDTGMWDPTNVDWGDVPVSPLPPVTNGPPEDVGTFPKCTVLYNYTAQNPDELTIVENEELELMGEGDGDGWVQARNYKGEVGYIPQNYIEMEDASAGGVVPAAALPAAEPAQEVPTTAPALETSDAAAISFSTIEYNLELDEEVAAPVSFSSMDYSFEQGGGYDEVEEYSSEPPPDLPPPPPAITTTTAPPAAVPPAFSLPVETNQLHQGDFCRAVYDYEATCNEEITFCEGQIIRILKRTVHDVDDGWWEGEVDGQVGLFPSLVVEECRSDGEPLTPDAVSGASPCTTPPPHTPPEVPGFLLPPERVIITQPTPVVETAEEIQMPTEAPPAPPATTTPATATTTNNATAGAAGGGYDSSAFELELSGQHQEQYSRQFSSSPESEATDRDQQYAELVSSPDVSNQEQARQQREQEPSSATSPDTLQEEAFELEPWHDEAVDPSSATTTTISLDEAGGLVSPLSEARVVEVCEPPESPPLPPQPPQQQESEGQPPSMDEAPDFPPPTLEETAMDPLPPPPPPEEEKEEEKVEAQQGATGKKARARKAAAATNMSQQQKQPKLPAEGGSGGDSDGLGVAQIVITAATPVVEAREARADEDSRAEADQDEDAHHPEAERSEVEGEALILDDEGRPPPPPPAPEGPMEMRMEACGAEGGIRDLGGSEERSPSPKSPSPSDGPPDLDPEKLKTLERIKESIA